MSDQKQKEMKFVEWMYETHSMFLKVFDFIFLAISYLFILSIVLYFFGFIWWWKLTIVSINLYVVSFFVWRYFLIRYTDNYVFSKKEEEL